MYIAPNAVSLGKTTPLASAANTTPTLVFGPGWKYLIVYHYIAGYGSGGGIAVLQLGTGTSVDTGTNYSSVTAHRTVGSATLPAPSSRISQVGIQVANDSVTTGRRGTHIIWNPEGDPKACNGQTATYNGAPTAATSVHTTISETVGHWWNNTQAQCIAMSGNGVTLSAGSYIDVYGLPS